MKPISSMTTACLTAGLALLLLGQEALGQTPSLRDKQAKQKPLPGDVRPFLPPPEAGSIPPPGPVHSIAEWEESEGVLTLWWNWDLVDRLQEQNQVYIPVDNQSQVDSWINYLGNHGVPMGNVHFLSIPTDTIWTRDYGPFFVWDANDDLGIIDYNYRFDPKDNLFPSRFAARFGIDYYDSGIEHVGGNWYPNGYSTAFTTTLIYFDNRHMTRPEIEGVLSDYWGIERYKPVYLAPGDLGHHDTWGKPSDPETLLLGQFPESASQYPYAEHIREHYETLESPWGRPYQILRIPMFKMNSGWYEFRPYLNALLSNERVFVPITYHPDDQVALGIFQDAFPGYEIVGVDHMGCGHNDALHCRTRNFVRRDPIRIYPMPPGDTEGAFLGHPVTAEVIPPKGWNLQSGYPKLRWSTTGGAPFSELIMAATATPDEYGATLPAQPQGTEVSFYIEALDDGGRSALYPMVAPDGLMSFRVRPDRAAPVLSRFAPTRSVSASQWPPSIRTLCKDDMTTPEVRVEWSLNGVPRPPVDLSREELCYWYSGELTGAASAGDLVRYRLMASDWSAAGNQSLLPRKGEVCCPVSGSGSVAVVDLSLRPVSGPFLAETLDSLGIPCTRYTSWPADWGEHEVWFILLGIYPDNHILTAPQANEVVAALQAGDRIYLEGGDAWCYDAQKDVIGPWFGVGAKADGGSLKTVDGLPGTLAEGLELDYAGPNLKLDTIDPVPPALKAFSTGGKQVGRVVTNDLPRYRTIASSFAVGALIDGDWPSTRKELVVRYLDFLGVGGVELKALGEAVPGAEVILRLEGTPGDAYIVMGSWAEDYVHVPGYGTLRLDASYMFVPGRGVIPRSGLVEVPLPISSDPARQGCEIHLQAVMGSQIQPGLASFTNRDILTIR